MKYSHDGYWSRDKDLKFFEEALEPCNFTSSICKSPVLSLCGGSRYHRPSYEVLLVFEEIDKELVLRRQGLYVVNTFLLIVSLCYYHCFIPFNVPISFVFNFEYPFAANGYLSGSEVLFDVGELLLSVFAVWVGELVFGVFGLVVGESVVDVLLDVWGMKAGMKGWVSYDVVGDCSLDEGLVVIKEITLLIVWVANEDCWYGFGAEFVIFLEQIGNNLTFINSAYALWNELYEHYSQLDGHRIYQLANEIVDLKQSKCTIEVYYHKLKGLWDEMNAIEAPYVCTYKGHVLLMQPLPTAAKAYSMLRHKEKQIDTHKQPLNAPIALNNYRTAYNVSNNSSYINNTPNPNTPSPNNQSDRSTFRKGVICTYFKKERHSKEECCNLLGYPMGHPLHKKYLPPSQRTQENGKNRTINMVMSESSNSPQQESPETTPLEPLPIPDETHVYARMDQLQN
nr:hypothetical protein [Tanacetum cinerariifolium]